MKSLLFVLLISVIPSMSFANSYADPETWKMLTGQELKKPVEVKEPTVIAPSPTPEDDHKSDSESLPQPQPNPAPAPAPEN